MATLKDILSRFSPAARREFEERSGYRSAAVPVGDKRTLNANQRRLLIAGDMDETSAFYTISCALMLDGPLDVAALRMAVDAVVERHPLLRSRVSAEGAEPSFVIGASQETPFEVVDLSDMPAASRDAELERLLARDAGHVFQLASEAPIRVCVYRLESARHALHLFLHHIVGDQWSLEVLRRDLLTAYEACRNGRSAWLGAPAEFQARDRRDDFSRADPSVRYWLRTLENVPSYIAFPARLPTREGRRVGARRYIGYGDLAGRVDMLGQAHDCTAFMVLVAALAVAVEKWTGQGDFCLGTRIAGRHHVDDRDTVGFFVNLLALRFTPRAEQTVADVLAATCERVLSAFDHQHVPFEVVVDELRLPRDGLVSPLIPLVVTYQNVPTSASAAAGLDLAITTIKQHNGSVRTELDFSFEGEGSSLELALEFRTDMFDEADVMALVGLHREILEAMHASPGVSVGALLRDVARPGDAVLAGPVFDNITTTLDTAFDRWSRERADDVAIVDGERRLTFDAWNRRSGALASGWRSRATGAPALVVLHLRRSIEWLVCTAACLRAGIPYLVIDPDLPEAYKLAALDRSSASLVVVAAESPLAIPDRIRVVDVDSIDSSAVSSMSPRDISPDDTAYVLLTSGSTGEPKPVAVSRRQLFNDVASIARAYPVATDDVMAQRTPAGFAPSAKEWMTALLHGVPVVIVPAAESVDMTALGRLVHAHGITRLHLIPSQLRLLLAVAASDEAPWRSLRMLVLAGEPLPTELAGSCRDILPAVRLLNNYGCTELNDITYAEPSGETDTPFAAIGLPIGNTRVYVLDDDLLPVTAGRAGIIHVSGMSVGSGYDRLPGLTACAYLPDPVAAEPGARMYRTHDMGRLRSDGTLEWLGRSDDLVKVNGCRVEPRQVESVIADFAPVRAVAVLGDANEGGVAHAGLSAFVRPVIPTDAQDALRRHIAEHLPRYMQPSRLVFLDTFPSLPNGKLDRVALRGSGRAAAVSAMVPSTPTASALVAIWQRVLGEEDVGPESDFFLVGGNSLSAGHLIVAIDQAFDVTLSLNDVLGISTLSSQANLIDARRAARADA